MMNRKAIIAKEILGLVIAALCMGALIYLAVSMYGIMAKKSELAQARETLKAITGKIETLKSGENTKYLVLFPKSWYIVAYKQDNVLPSVCNGKDCLCICPAKNAPTGLKEGVEPYVGDIMMPGLTADVEEVENSKKIEQIGGALFYLSRFEGLKNCNEQGVCMNIDNVVIEFGDKISVGVQPIAEKDLSLEDLEMKILEIEYSLSKAREKQTLAKEQWDQLPSNPSTPEEIETEKELENKINELTTEIENFEMRNVAYIQKRKILLYTIVTTKNQLEINILTQNLNYYNVEDSKQWQEVEEEKKRIESDLAYHSEEYTSQELNEKLAEVEGKLDYFREIYNRLKADIQFIDEEFNKRATEEIAELEEQREGKPDFTKVSWISFPRMPKWVYLARK